MPFQINQETKEITIGVAELASETTIRSGGMAAAVARLTAGRKVHEIYQSQQSQKIESYRKEFPIDFRYRYQNYTFIIQGRIDGFYQTFSTTIVEEIKSVILPEARFSLLQPIDYPNYLKQLQIYCFILEKMGNPTLEGYLIFINLIDQNQRRFKIDCNFQETQSFIEYRFEAILKQLRMQAEWNAQRQMTEKYFQFPYPEIRLHQDQLMADVAHALDSRCDMLISAPAGIGKTVAVLYTTLKAALKNGLRLFYITSKTTQQKIVQETLAIMNQQENVSLRKVTIQAREKVCINDVYFCHPDFCPFLNRYDEKVQQGELLTKLLKNGSISPALIQQIAIENQVCPFELTLDLSLLVDVIIGDYNYVFDPGVYLKRFFFETKYDHFILIIDEAHNLYTRGRDYYSPAIWWDDIQHLLFRCQKQKAPIFNFLARIFREIDFIFRKLSVQTNLESAQEKKIIIELDSKPFSQFQDALSGAMLDYYIYKKLNGILDPDDPFDAFYYKLMKFASVLSLGGDEFCVIYDRSTENHGLKILCHDPSHQLNQRIRGFYATIGMSATLEPLEFYRDVSGFNEKTILESYPSPFPPENRKIIVIPTISTRYQDRVRAVTPIAEVIQEVISIRPGNYFAFFPSFQFMEMVAEQIYRRDFQIIRQTRSMDEKSRAQILEQLCQPELNNLILAVQGGIFAEGVDYPGEMLIGAFIIGPGLPQFSFEQELMKKYYQEHYTKGFEYAYLYPGMNRVIQSAGRVIRTPKDRGLIILIDQRFATSYYNSIFPNDWYRVSPSELIFSDYTREIESFWQK